MESSFIDILRKKDEPMDDKEEVKEEKISTLLDSLKEKNLKDTEILVRVLDIYSRNPDLQDPKIRQPLRSFLDIFDTRINDITSLVRGLGKKSGFEKLRRRFGGRYFPAFAKFTKGKDERGKSIIELREYNNQKADRVYLNFVREVPGLSSSGGSIDRKKYVEVQEYVDAIYNNTLSISKAKTELREAVEIAKKGNAEEIAKSFKSIKGRMLNTFTEMAIEISDFKDIAEDVGFRGIDDVMQLGIGGMKGFARLSGNLEDSVEFLQVSYSYVGNLLTLKASDVLSDVESLVADNPMIQIKKPKTNVKETEEEDELDTKLLAEAKLMFSTMERLVDDIDGYTFKIPNSDDIVVDLDDGKLIQFK